MRYLRILRAAKKGANRMKTYFYPKKMAYHGPELRPHFLLSQFKIEGSVLSAFIGPCDVKTDHLVDWEDRLNDDSIRAKKMLHFLGEFFGVTLKEGIWIQRLIVSEIERELRHANIPVTREGDDLWVKVGKLRKKLSVSIVTVSSVSALLHLGINIDATGAPVAAIGLQELGVEPNALAKKILKKFQTEYEGVMRASVKVRPV